MKDATKADNMFTKQELILISSALVYTHNFDDTLSSERKEILYELGLKVDNMVTVESNSSSVGENHDAT